MDRIEAGGCPGPSPRRRGFGPAGGSNQGQSGAWV